MSGKPEQTSIELGLDQIKCEVREFLLSDGRLSEQIVNAYIDNNSEVVIRQTYNAIVKLKSRPTSFERVMERRNKRLFSLSVAVFLIGAMNFTPDQAMIAGECGQETVCGLVLAIRQHI